MKRIRLRPIRARPPVQAEIQERQCWAIATMPVSASARGRVGPDHLEPRGGDAAGQPAGAAAQIEDGAADLARQPEIEFIARRPGIEVVVDGGEQGIVEDVGGLGHRDEVAP